MIWIISVLHCTVDAIILIWKEICQNSNTLVDVSVRFLRWKTIRDGAIVWVAKWVNIWIAPERIKKNICKNLELRNILVYDRLSHIQPYEQNIIGPEKNSKSPPTPFNWWRCSMWRLASLWRNVCLRGKVFPIMMIYRIHCIDTWRDSMHVLFCAQC